MNDVSLKLGCNTSNVFAGDGPSVIFDDFIICLKRYLLNDKLGAYSSLMAIERIQGCLSTFHVIYLSSGITCNNLVIRSWQDTLFIVEAKTTVKKYSPSFCTAVVLVKSIVCDMYLIFLQLYLCLLQLLCNPIMGRRPQI